MVDPTSAARVNANSVSSEILRTEVGDDAMTGVEAGFGVSTSNSTGRPCHVAAVIRTISVGRSRRAPSHAINVSYVAGDAHVGSVRLNSVELMPASAKATDQLKTSSGGCSAAGTVGTP